MSGAGSQAAFKLPLPFVSLHSCQCCCSNYPAIAVLDHWYAEMLVARKIVHDCFRESSASNSVDKKPLLLYIVTYWFDI